MKRLPRSRLFLFELTIDLVFFCICAAVCLTLLARAQALTRQSDELGGAMLAAENAAESFAAANGDAGETARLLGACNPNGDPDKAVAEQDVLGLFFDESWKPAPETEAAYRLTMHIGQAQSRLATAEIEVTRVSDGASVYQLETRRFVRGAAR